MLSLRVSPVILFSGWLLMYPPLTDRPYPFPAARVVNPSAPISQWEQLNAYDSAEACESDRQSRIATAQDMASRLPGLAPPPGGLLYLRCVPADSVYPPLRPAQ